MALVLEGWTENNAGSGTETTITLTKPTDATVQIDDLLMLIVGTDGSEETEQWGSDPDSDGWTKIFEVVGSTSPRCDYALYVKYADGGEGASVTADHTAADELWGFYLHFTGADDTDINSVIEVLGTNSEQSNVTTHPFTALSTLTNGAIVVAALTFDGGEAGFSISTGTGWATLVEEQAGTTSNDASGAITWKTIATAGSSGSLEIDSASADGSYTRMFAVKPATATAVVANGTPAEATCSALDGTGVVVSPGTYEQEGFRWRSDDGSESTATWLEAQDTNRTGPAETTVRLRFLVNLTGSVRIDDFKARVRKVGDADSEWEDPA